MQDKRSFFDGVSKGMRIAFYGFCVAVIGAVIAIPASSLGLKAIFIAGYVVAACGILLGFVGILYGWLFDTKIIVRNMKQRFGRDQSRTDEPRN